MSGDPFVMHQGLGVQLQSFSLVEFAGVAEGIAQCAVADDVEKVKQLQMPHKDTSDDDLPMASRLYLTMRHFLECESLDALAIRCWPEMPNTFGQWPYLGLARLADEGLAVACEGDVDGALAAWIGESLGMGRCYHRLARPRRVDDHAVAWRHVADVAFTPARRGGRSADCPALQQ
jgi:L-fucose isomerase-like protein